MHFLGFLSVEHSLKYDHNHAAPNHQGTPFFEYANSPFGWREKGTISIFWTARRDEKLWDTIKDQRKRWIFTGPFCFSLNLITLVENHNPFFSLPCSQSKGHAKDSSSCFIWSIGLLMQLLSEFLCELPDFTLLTFFFASSYGAAKPCLCIVDCQLK